MCDHIIGFISFQLSAPRHFVFLHFCSSSSSCSGFWFLQEGTKSAQHVQTYSTCPRPGSKIAGIKNYSIIIIILVIIILSVIILMLSIEEKNLFIIKNDFK